VLNARLTGAECDVAERILLGSSVADIEASPTTTRQRRYFEFAIDIVSNLFDVAAFPQ